MPFVKNRQGVLHGFRSRISKRPDGSVMARLFEVDVQDMYEDIGRGLLRNLNSKRLCCALELRLSGYFVLSRNYVV